jgi:hypothetical protein
MFGLLDFAIRLLLLKIHPLIGSSSADTRTPALLHADDGSLFGEGKLPSQLRYSQALSRLH